MEDQQIITIALLKARGIDSLNIAEIKALTTFFHIPVRENPHEALIELKKTISFIILIERNDIEQYMALQKFKRLPPNIGIKLHAYVMELYHLFMAEKIAIDKTSLKQFQQIKSPMDKLSQSFQSMRTNQQRQSNNNMNYGFYPQFGSNTPDYTAQPIPNFLFPYQNYMGGSMTNVYDDYNNRGGMIDNLIIQNQNSPQEEVHFKQEQVSEKESLHAELKNVEENQCYCEQYGDPNILKCLNCDNKFHFKCWQAQNYPDAICPTCRLKTHCYTKLMGQPILQRKSKADENSISSKKIYLTQQQIDILHEYLSLVQSTGKCWIQLRFVKIVKDHDQKKGGFRSCFPLGLVEAKKIQSRRWIELKYKNITKGEILVFLLVCVTVKDLSQLSKQIQQNHKIVDNSLLSNWMSNNGVQSYNLNFIHPIKKQRIAFPVRGARCSHIECEELSVVYEQGIKKEGIIICSYCGKQYTTYEYFHFDPHVLALLDSTQQNQVEVSKPLIDRLLHPGIINMDAMQQEEIR